MRNGSKTKVWPISAERPDTRRPRAVKGTVAPVGPRKPPNERWHQTLKNRILLKHYYLPGALEEQVGAFVERYNHSRAYESLKNLPPADVYLGRGKAILAERERIKKQTLTQRRLQHHAAAA